MYPVTSKLAVIVEMMDAFLRQENKELHYKKRQLEQEVDDLAARVSEQNRLISQLNTDIDGLIDAVADAEHTNDQLRRTTRLLYSTDGGSALFTRNADGVFVQVEEPPQEERPSEVARRLNFESDSDSEMEDEFMNELMFG